MFYQYIKKHIYLVKLNIYLGIRETNEKYFKYFNTWIAIEILYWNAKKKREILKRKLIYILTNFVKSHYKCINESINLLFSVKK